MTNDTTKTAEPVRCTGAAPGCRNLRPPWKKGQSGNPKGSTSYKRSFEAALGRAVEQSAEALVAKLVGMAREGDARMMAILVDRLVPKMQRHELDAAGAPTKMVITFEKPEAVRT